MNGQHQHNQRASHFRLRGRFPPPLSPSPSSAAAAANGDGSSSFATIATTDTTTPEQDSTAELQRLLRVPGTEICRSKNCKKSGFLKMTNFHLQKNNRKNQNFRRLTELIFKSIFHIRFFNYV